MARPGLSSFLGSLFIGSLGGAATSACSLGEGYADFGRDVAQPEMVTVDGPGIKIADGQLSGMLVDPWGENGAVVVGFRYIDGVPNLRMQPFGGGKGCNVGRAFRCIVFNQLPNEPQLIAYLDDNGDDGRGTLNFTDHHCNVVYGGIPNAVLPERLFDSPPGLLVLSGNQLLDVDPYRKKTRVISENVSRWSGPGAPEGKIPIWYIGNGQLVVIDHDTRAELARTGNDVTEVVFDPNGDYIRQGLYLVDGGTLTRYVEATGTTPSIVDTDVCGVGLGPYGVSYLSPCGERKLIIKDPDKGYEFEVDTAVSGLLMAQVRSSSTGSGFELDALYTKPSTIEGAADDLWLKQGAAPPKLWQSRLARFIAASITGPSPTLVAIVDSDGTSGRLIRIESEGERTLCTGIHLSHGIETTSQGWLVLTDVADGFGALTLVSAEGQKTTVVQRYPVDAKVKAPRADPSFDGITDTRYFDLRAFIGERSENGLGTITLLNRNDITQPLSLGSKVPAEMFEFFRNMPALGYIDEFNVDLGTGTLNVFQTRVGAASTVARNVNEFAELLWPYEGVIYSVKKDDKYSIWAARAKP